MNNEELLQKIEELTQRVLLMETAQNLDQKVLLFDGLFTDKGGFNADIQRTLSATIGAGGGSFSFTVLEDPIATLKIDYKGTKYRLPLYSLS